jgi:hypothetical protein
LVFQPAEERVIAAATELEVVGTAVPLRVGVRDRGPVGLRPVHEIRSGVATEPGALGNALEVG